MRLLIGFKGLVWLAYALVYGLLFAPGYARIVFRLDGGDVERAHESCTALATCGTQHDAFVSDQIGYLSTVATFLRASAWAMVALDGVVLVLAIAFAIQGTWRPGSLRLLWRVQLAAAVAALVGYASLMIIGSSKLSGIPESAQLLSFQVAFDSPFTDFGTYYYLAGFVGSTALTVGLTVALASVGASQGRRMTAHISAPLPNSPTFTSSQPD
jgi:hypothetical protein